MDSKRCQSYEDYLECIVAIEEEKGFVRSIDVSNRLGFTRASISIAIRKLEKDGLINIDEETYYLTLTDQGRAIGEKILNRHRTIQAFFEKIGVNKEQASKDACLIEHDLSDETFSKFVEFLNK